MIRKSLILAALATSVAAGSAFAATKVTGDVTQIDKPNGYVWVEGVKYDVGQDFASGILPGNTVELIVVPTGTENEVVHAAHAGF